MCLPTVKCPRGTGCLLATRIESGHVTTPCTLAGISTLFQCTFQSFQHFRLATGSYWPESGYSLPIFASLFIFCCFCRVRSPPRREPRSTSERPSVTRVHTGPRAASLGAASRHQSKVLTLSYSLMYYLSLIHTYSLPVVPPRGRAEVALGLYYKTFSSVELACAVRQPGPCVRALCEAVAVVVQEHDLHATPVQCNAKRTLSSHFTRAPHFTLHTCASHSTLHTSSHLISSHLIRALLTSSHLISALLISSHLLSHVI